MRNRADVYYDLQRLYRIADLIPQATFLELDAALVAELQGL